MSNYNSTHTGAELDEAIGRVLDGGEITERLSDVESEVSSFSALSASGYRIAGFIAPNNSYLSKAVENTCYFATNPSSSSWHDNVAGRVYLPPTSWTPSGDTRPQSVTGWAIVEMSSVENNGFAILFGYRNGQWSTHRLPYALQTTIENVQASLSTTNSAIASAKAQMGYYTCSTGGGTAAKTVDATGYVLPANGGHVKIKMTNKNTVNNATLNINSTGAKPLFYQGERAGADNTWDANGIIEVFYDGTNYQASPFNGADGGGGGGITVLGWKTNAQTTRNQIPNTQRKKGMLITYQNPNVLDNGGWVVEQCAAEPIMNANFGLDANWIAYANNDNVEYATTNGLVRSITLKNTTGTFDDTTNTLTWAAGVTPDTNDGFYFRIGEFDKGITERMWKLYQMGVRPSIRLVVETKNISVGHQFLGFNKVGNLETSYNFQNKVEFDKYVLYKDNFTMSANTAYFTCYCKANVVADITQESSIRFVSIDIYYKSPIWNTYVKEGREYNPVQKTVKFDPTFEGTEYVHVIDDETVLLTIPAGTSIPVRSLFAPMPSFSLPLEKPVTGTYRLVMEYDGANPTDELNYWEISVETSVNLVGLQQDKVNSFDIPNANVFMLSIGNTAAYNDIHNYQKVGLRFGINGSNPTSTDLVTKFKLKLVGWSPDEVYRDDLSRIREQIHDLRKAVGNYTSEFYKPFIAISGKSEHVVFDGRNSVRIPSGTAMANEYIDIMLNVSRIADLGLTTPILNVKCMTNYTSQSDIPVTATVHSPSGMQFMTVDTDYGEMYNGYIVYNIRLLKQTTGLSYITLRLTFTSQSTDGLFLSVTDSSVNDVMIRDDIRTEIDNLKSPDRKLYVKSVNGKRFRLVVDDNGNLSTAPAIPSKMLVLAHSWGKISPSPANGWYGDWGLAASTEALDMVHQIETMGKQLNPQFTTYFHGFIDFTSHFNDPVSYWESHYVMSEYDFDSICISSFASGASDWSGFGQALFDLVTNYICRGKSNIPVYIIHGFGDDTQLEIAASLLGTTLINVKSFASDRNTTGWPWLMPANPETGVRPIKRTYLPSGADPTLYMRREYLTHPGNWGFYKMAKMLVNQMYIDFEVQNPDPTILTYSQYANLPEMRQYVDPKWDATNQTYDET